MGERCVRVVVEEFINQKFLWNTGPVVAIKCAIGVVVRVKE